MKSRARIRQAIKGYKEINLQAIKLLRQGGYLITCSCSHHLSQEMLLDLLNDAASDAKKNCETDRGQNSGTGSSYTPFHKRDRIFKVRNTTDVVEKNSQIK